MEKPAKRYMVNTRTKVVWAYNANAMRLNSDLVECNEIGVPIGRPETVTDDLYDKIIELEGVIAEKDLRISALESRLAAAEAELKAATVNPRKEELNELNLAELRKLAESMDLDIPVRSSKSEFIDAIYAAELIAESPIDTGDK